MIAFATIGRFCDEEMVVSVGATREEARALADKFHRDRAAEWIPAADREAWLDGLAVVELSGDISDLRRLIDIAVYGVETTATASIAHALHPRTKQEP